MTIEACVTTIEEAVAAEMAGADRLELCRDLPTGGLTPRTATARAVCGTVSIPVHVMIRDTPVGFACKERTVLQLADHIEMLTACGAAGFVFGFLKADDAIDEEATRRLVTAARGRPVTFHRAFDRTVDPLGALGALEEMGVARVLTAGGPGSAWANRSRLRTLTNRAERIVVMAGGAVRADHACRLSAETGITEVHARADAIPDLVRAFRPI